MYNVGGIKAPHQTRVRPPTEPWEFHRARQRAQQKDMKVYLRGRPIWRSNMLMPLYEGLIVVGTKPMPLQGTYKTPICPLCLKKEKRGHCKCSEGL